MNIALLESDTLFGFGAQLVSENTKVYNELDTITESQRQLLGMNIDKITINGTQDNYLIEYSNNLERYIKDQQIYTIEEAIENICEHYEIEKENITIVVDEQDIDKIDIGALRNSYRVLKK